METKLSKNIERVERSENGIKFIMKPSEYVSGDYVERDGEVSAEELKVMKAEVVDKICNLVRLAAETHDDFFIVKTGEKTTVGAKFIIPTIKL
jgi:hypothetical protein